MKNYLLKLNSVTPDNLLKDMESPLVGTLTKGVALDELKEFTEKIFAESPLVFQLLLYLVKNSYLYLEYTDEEGRQVDLFTPHLTHFFTTDSLEDKGHSLPLLELHAHTITLKDNQKTKIFNPYKSTSIRFSGGLYFILNLLQTNALFHNLVQSSELFSLEPLAENNSSVLLDEAFYTKTHEDNDHLFSDETLIKLMAEYPRVCSGKILQLTDLRQLNLADAIYNRASLRSPSPALNLKTLTELLELVFADTEMRRKLYPSAGGIYEIYPVVYLYDDSVGLPKGAYRYKGGQENPFAPLGNIGLAPSNQDQRFTARCCISLIAEPKVIGYKYGPLSFKLSLLNAGVMISYLSIFSSALGLHGCAYGSKSTRVGQLPRGHKDLAGFHLF